MISHCNRSKASIFALLFALTGAAGACGGDVPPPTQAATPDLLPSAPGSAAAAPEVVTEPAHALLIQAASCWFGGLWSDADKQSLENRRAAAEARCHALVVRLYGSDDMSKYDQLRTIAAPAVDAIAAAIDKAASKDAVDGPRKDALGKLLHALATAQHENNDARIASDTVKQDLKSSEAQETLSKDELAAVTPLRARAGLEALMKIDVGDLSSEAHAMSLLCAMDRMELSRGLTKHLKVYAVGEAYNLVFNVPSPAVPSDAAAKLKPGVWLAYLTDVAKAAGHAVPDTAKVPREREPWAWGGVLAGFSDKLKTDAAKIAPSSPLAKATSTIIQRLDAEWAEIPSVAADQKKMAESEAKPKTK